MANQQPQQPQRTASQRIDDLERGLMSIYQTADNMARDLGVIKEAIKLLGNKLDSIVKLSERGEALNDTAIAKVMVENNIAELKGKVDGLIANGTLVAVDTVGPNSFVVGRELAEDGSVPNPRMQFVVAALNPDVKDKFPGAKVGQILNLQEGKWTFEVQEIYSIQEPKAPEAPVAAPVVEATAEAAPAAESAPEAAPAATAEVAPAPESTEAKA